MRIHGVLSHARLVARLAVATLSLRVPSAFALPRVLVGTFELVSSSDSAWTRDTWTQYPNASFVGSGQGTWAGATDPYTYHGAVTDYDCDRDDASGNVTVVQKFWYHDETYHADGKKAISCVYQTLRDGVDAYDAVQYTSSVLDDSIEGGDCPATAAAADASGISWMTGAWTKTNVMKCVRDCQPSPRDCSAHEDEDEDDDEDDEDEDEDDSVIESDSESSEGARRFRATASAALLSVVVVLAKSPAP